MPIGKEVTPMSLAPLAVIPLADSNVVDMSAGGLTVLAIVSVISLAALLIPVMLAGREHPRRNPNETGPRPASNDRPVMGGSHVGDPRSVAPHRDATVEPVSPGSGGDER
jgi:hypothetical protein